MLFPDSLDVMGWSVVSRGLQVVFDQRIPDIIRVHAAAELDALLSAHGLTRDDGLVAAFAPWALLGPALGIPSVLPRMDLSAPDSLSASALADAVGAGHGTVLWASPAALANVLATQSALDDAGRAHLAGLRLALGAGAPVSPAILAGMRDLLVSLDAKTGNVLWETTIADYKKGFSATAAIARTRSRSSGGAAIRACAGCGS